MLFCENVDAIYLSQQRTNVYARCIKQCDKVSNACLIMRKFLQNSGFFNLKTPRKDEENGSIKSKLKRIFYLRLGIRILGLDQDR
jgi:hypothetical protein